MVDSRTVVVVEKSVSVEGYIVLVCSIVVLVEVCTAVKGKIVVVTVEVTVVGKTVASRKLEQSALAED